VDVRSSYWHSFSTSAGDMPGPLSATKMVRASTRTVITGPTPTSSQASRPLSASSLITARGQ
jgi:hypothetical protein